MTIIAAIRSDEGVLVGADTCVSCGEYYYEENKLWRVGNICIGVAGSSPGIAHARYGVDWDTVAENLSGTVLYTEVVKQINDSLDDEEVDGLSILVASPHEIWIIDTPWDVSLVRCSGVATGSGAPAWMGAYKATQCHKASYEERMLNCLIAAENVCPDLRSPFILEWLPVAG